jgi:hypothetical protein
MGYFLVFFGLLVATNARAVDITWVKMDINFAYQDLSKSCYPQKSADELYLATEHEGDKISRIVISNYIYVWPYKYIYKSIELNREEIADSKLYRDAKDRYWIKNLKLNENSLKWILYWIPQKYGYCTPSQPLKTLSAAPVLYEFETEGIDEGILISYSKYFSFSGQREDGQNYTAKLRLVQKEFKE